MDKIIIGSETIVLYKSNKVATSDQKGVLTQSQFTGRSADGKLRIRYITGPTRLKGGAKKTLASLQVEEDIVEGTETRLERYTINTTFTCGDSIAAQQKLLSIALGFMASLSCKNGAEISYRVELDAADPLALDATLMGGVLTAMLDVTP